MKFSFTVAEKNTVIEFLSDKLSGVSVSALKQLLKKREIKVDGRRTSQNIQLDCGNVVEIFVPNSFMGEQGTIVFEDENILVANKPPFCSVTGGLVEQFSQKYPLIVPTHRIDTNTRGLVVFALTRRAEGILLAAFKERTITKKYRAITCGIPKEGRHKAFLFKDQKNSTCYISDNQKTGYKEIITDCKVLKSYKVSDDISNIIGENHLSEVELTLVTGRTHQIRAHLKHLGCPILGDDKYGDYKLNKFFGLKYQQLVAVSIEFGNLPPPLDSLEGKKITLDHQFPQGIFEKIKG